MEETILYDLKGKLPINLYKVFLLTGIKFYDNNLLLWEHPLTPTIFLRIIGEYSHNPSYSI